MQDTKTAEASQLLQTIEVVPAANSLPDFRAYYELTKPGITQMVMFSVAAGYYLGLSDAAQYFTDYHSVIHLLAVVIGAALISGGSCVFNNMMERNYDKNMKRTARRSSANGTISLAKGTVFGTMLTVVAMGILWWANPITAILAFATLVLYVGVYTPLKRKSAWNTLVGSFPGALPPLGGFVAATGELGIGGWLLFAVLFLWQIPHFFALAWMYKADYEEGGFIMLPLYDKQGIATAWISLITAVMLLPVSWMFYQLQIAGILFVVGSIVAGLVFTVAAGLFVKERSVVKARTMLIASYIYLLAVFLLVFFDKA